MPSGTTRRISVQLGPKGITSINTFNFINSDQPPVTALSKPSLIRSPAPVITSSSSNSFNDTNTNASHLSNSANGVGGRNSPVLYRTELTIMPFNPNSPVTSAAAQQSSQNNNVQSSSSTASTSSNNSPLYKNIHKFWENTISIYLFCKKKEKKTYKLKLYLKHFYYILEFQLK